MAPMSGGVLWGVLAGLTLAARFLQWQIRKAQRSRMGGLA